MKDLTPIFVKLIEEQPKCLDHKKKPKLRDNFLSDSRKIEKKEEIVEINELISNLFNAIEKLKSFYVNKSKAHLNQHRKLVYEALLCQLKVSCQLYVQFQSSKANNVMEHIELSKLHVPFMKISRVFEENHLKDIKTSNNNQEPHLNTPNYIPDFSPEESQLFEEENEKMFEEYTSSINELQSIEKKIIEITRLQNVLTENLLDQENNVDRVAQNTFTTTENVKLGNTEIFKALQHKAGTRVWVLFILIILTFSLLFLDWYNP